jgi:O-acetyl-ADP-ribose deacetylase (regulator of RNase III)
MSMTVIGTSRIFLLPGDITEQQTDAIVNAANSTLMGGGGVDGAIHRKGGTEILEECRIIRKSNWPEGLPAGEAVVTSGGRLKAKMVIHTVGPIWKGGNEGEAQMLAKAYGNCLALALEMHIRSISFPSISTGAYGYPIEKASGIALSTVLDFIKEHNGIDEVHFVLHSQHDLMIYEAALKEVIQTGFTGSTGCMETS